MKNLQIKLKKFLKNKDIIDLIIFGSKAKGRNKSNDVDILILTETYDQELKKEIKTLIPDSDIQFISLKDYDKFIWLTMIREGFSLKNGEYLFNLYKIKPKQLYKYSLKDLTNSKKVMFERAIKNFEGIEKLSNRVILVPVEKSSEFEDFLKLWNLDIDVKEYYLLPLVRKEN
ncbi:MAG: nucleotidyltransferase domain-containing protein [Candidatus Nanoarchaeia archaeon]|nr:nucleotidyltransferase domain-containing protein [Candidatus Nanoarchaeia archaeon]